MTEITEVRQTHAAVAKHFADLHPIETRRRQGIRSITDKEKHDETTDDGKRGNKQHIMTPILTADSIDEIWHSFAERQCAYEDTKRQTAAMSKPGSQNLHCRRINPGEKHSGQKAQTDGHPRIVRKQREAAIHRRAGGAQPSCCS